MGRSVSVVLITFNSARYLPRCFSGIAGQTFPDVRIIVIDNASNDASVDIATRHAGAAGVITNSQNRGFATAANQGIAASDSDFVLLVNPDVFLQPTYISGLVKTLEQSGHHFGSATGKLLRAFGDSIEPTGLVDSKGIRMTRNGRHLDIASGEPDTTDSVPVEVFGVSGAAALYRRAFLEDAAIDGQIFDEDFFAFREDADLSWRGQLLGWKAIYVPTAVAFHVRRVRPELRQQLPPEINMHSVKNRFLLRLKNEGRDLALRNGLFELTRDLVVLAAALTVERTSLPAFGWLIKNRRRILERRKSIQARRRVSDRDLSHWFV